MIDPLLWVTFIGASAIIAVVPGPTVTVIAANSLRHGAKAGMLNIAGTQAGLTLMIVIVAAGLEFITTSLAFLFDWLRLFGAIYLIWLGVKLLRSDGSLGSGSATKAASPAIWFWQGFIVIWSNPKALLMFGAFLPQFIDPTGNAVAQTLVLGFTFMATATVLDSMYALLAGKAGSALSKRNVRAAEIGGGAMLVGGGIWLGLTRNA